MRYRCTTLYLVRVIVLLTNYIYWLWLKLHEHYLFNRKTLYLLMYYNFFSILGQKASVTETRSSRELSWCSVFDHPESGRYLFEVSIGTSSGFADIQKPYKTNDCMLPVNIPTGTTEVYTVVHCYGNSPDFGIYRDVLLVWYSGHNL